MLKILLNQENPFFMSCSWASTYRLCGHLRKIRTPLSYQWFVWPQYTITSNIIILGPLHVRLHRAICHATRGAILARSVSVFMKSVIWVRLLNEIRHEHTGKKKTWRTEVGTCYFSFENCRTSTIPIQLISSLKLQQFTCRCWKSH